MRRHWFNHGLGILLALLLVAPLRGAERGKPAPCGIAIVEAGTGWPVPLVGLRTTHQLEFFSDNAGMIACDAPELMDREVWFEVFGDGYEVARDGFGYRGVRLRPEPGKQLRIEVRRTMIAKRMGRITGAGLFAESQKLGRELDWAETGVFGCDSVQTAVYRGKLFWLWGDTTLPRYPLGVFHSTSATSAIQPLTQFQPPLRLKLDYFTDDHGQPRGVAQMAGSGPTWLSAYLTLHDQSGQPHLVATYAKIKPPLAAYEFGLCEWNEATAAFELRRVLWKKTEASETHPPLPEGQPAFWKDAQGQEWVLLGDPFPRLRFPATYEAWRDTEHWETLTPPATLRSGSDEKVTPHSGHLAWNEFRQRWVAVFMEKFGQPSAFGELWYAEAPTPTGPWGRAVKILSHANYTFYNPRLHPEFTPTNAAFLFFEGTYTQTFANHPHPTPRYDYNQVLYRLDLDDPALRPAQEE